MRGAEPQREGRGHDTAGHERDQEHDVRGRASERNIARAVADDAGHDTA